MEQRPNLIDLDCEAYEANRKISLAFTLGWIDDELTGDLVDLLKSDCPITANIRDELAAALLGEHRRMTLKLSSKRRGPRKDRDLFGVSASQRLSVVGNFIREYIGTSAKVESGIEAAMAAFNIGRSYAFEAWEAQRKREKQGKLYPPAGWDD